MRDMLRGMIVAPLALIAIGLSLNSQSAVAQDSKDVLDAFESGVTNEQQFQSIFDFVRSSDSEEKWREIGWIPSLWAGVEMAAEKQKPIFVWAMNGDPLGCV